MLLVSTTNISDALTSAVSTKKRAVATVSLTAVTFSLLILSSFPVYSYQLISSSITYFPTALTDLTMNLYASSGALGMGLIILYAFLTGPALITLYLTARYNGWRAVFGAGSFAPAALIGGCASCGAGILGLLGLVGATALFPFQGNGVRAVGALLLLLYLGKVGNPETCEL